MERIPLPRGDRDKRDPVKYIQIRPDEAGRRIDNYLAAELGDVPRSRIYQMLRRGEVRVNGKRVRQGYRLEGGEQVRIPPVISRETAGPSPPRDYLLDLVRDSIIYQDDRLLAINKPAGLVVHGGSGRTYGVIELLRLLYSEQAGDLQLVHRLDRETSGVLLIARTHASLAFLQQCFRDRRMGKSYMALLKGALERKPVSVDIPLQRNVLRAGERLSGISGDGKQARTRFECIRIIKDTSLVDVNITTGRTHQIRVHAAAINHPVAGDGKYGDKSFNSKLRKAGLKRLFLHASSIEIPAATEGKRGITITAPLPADLEGFLRGY